MKNDETVKAYAQKGHLACVVGDDEAGGAFGAQINAAV
jgi:hypothetical protein